MTDDELELAILKKYVEHHKIIETTGQQITNKCDRDLDMREVLQWLTGEEDANLDYLANLWIGRLAPRTSGKTKSLLRPCSNSDLNTREHKYHARAFTDPINSTPAPAWDQIRELEEKGTKKIGGKEVNYDFGRRDSLTQLWDRETFDLKFSENIGETEKTSNPLSLIIVDIDHFKRVNDEHGHLKGDLVLKEVAQCLLNTIKGKGEGYRYGGDEIILLLPNYSVCEAIALAERARLELEALKIDDITITASLGISVYPEHGNERESLFKAADTALYDAKNRGRNLVRVFDEPEPVHNETRETERKQPESGKLTLDQKQQLFLNHFRGKRITCPFDEAILDVHNATTLGSVGSEILIHCPICGLSERLDSSSR